MVLIRPLDISLAEVSFTTLLDPNENLMVLIGALDLSFAGG